MTLPKSIVPGGRVHVYPMTTEASHARVGKSDDTQSATIHWTQNNFFSPTENQDKLNLSQKSLQYGMDFIL